MFFSVADYGESIHFTLPTATFHSQPNSVPQYVRLQILPSNDQELILHDKGQVNCRSACANGDRRAITIVIVDIGNEGCVDERASR